MIDLRSDTVTKPTEAMRRAMAEAEVGDDVYGEDPTVNRLEERAAEIAGKEAALFVPTGTMGNTIAIKLLTLHGQEVICEARAHLLDWELSMTAWFSGVTLRPVPSEDGILRWKEIAEYLKPGGPHRAATAAVEIENTHNMGGGRVYPVDVIQEICEESHARGLKVHMDGARVFNAAEACGRPVRDVVKHVDTVMFCLSKALGAPAGSMLAGTKERMAEARLLRKRLGGGMRQAGVLAAAGLIALEEMPAGLRTDHENARAFAHTAGLDPGAVESNIVMIDVGWSGRAPAEISARLKERGVLINTVDGPRLRAVTHFGVSRADCEEAARVLVEITGSARGSDASPDSRGRSTPA